MGITLVNVKDAVLKDIKFTGFRGPLLSMSNVTRKGLEGAPLPPWRPGEALDEPLPALAVPV
jgi:hypothetical protein